LFNLIRALVPGFKKTLLLSPYWLTETIGHFLFYMGLLRLLFFTTQTEMNRNLFPVFNKNLSN